MKKVLGKKWKQLTEEQQENLLSQANTWDSKGETIIDLTENLSVSGYIENINGEDVITIDDEAIIYDPSEGARIENPKFKDLISLKDAAEMFNKDESTLRRNISNGLFKEWEDCIKFGKQWVFDIKALERVYKKRGK